MQNIKTMLRDIMYGAIPDLEQAAAEMGERLTYEDVSDFACDTMWSSDLAADWEQLDYEFRRNLANEIAKEMV
jgi:hypothetical protein